MNKLFDLGFVIGAFFSVIGAVLIIYSLLIGDERAHNINFGCGVIFIVFGLVFISISMFNSRKQEKEIV